MSHIKSLGIDLAKNIFQLHGVDGIGKCTLRKRIKRNNFSEFIANLHHCLIVMEVCVSAHYSIKSNYRMGNNIST